MATGIKVPVVGEDGLFSEGRPLPISCLPVEVGLRRQAVEYTCIDASQQFLVVGSAQGYVWVVDLQSSRLLREFSEFKGSAITVVKLNPVRDYVAYGTDDGFVRIERLSKVMSTKLRVQEKSGQCVNCIEWSQNGEDIFCAFSLGRLVQFNVKFKDGIMNHVQLYPDQYGSAVIQLSNSENLLLVSTVDRAFLLDISTNKLAQVGRKDRKSGTYGGCFIENGQTMLLARPGLRMWIADKFGKVLSTMGFKEALSSDHLPSVMFNSIRTSPLCFSRSWQFSTLQSMLGGKFVITFQGSTLFVLDSMNGVVVGAAILKHNIKSVSISGGSLYILTSAVSKAAIVRVGVHYSYVTVENEPRKLLSAWSTPSTSVNNSPMGSLENLVDPETVTVGHASCEKHEQLSDEKSQADNSDAVTEQPDRGVPTLYLSEPCSGDTATLLEADGKYESAVLPNIFQQDLDQGTNQHEPLHPSQSEKEHQNTPPTLREERVQDTSGEWESSNIQLADPREHSRRLRMSQAAGDDIVAGSKGQHKRKKKTKGKKLSSAASSTSVSMEKLADIAEEEVEDQTVQITVNSSLPIQPQDVCVLADDLSEAVPDHQDTLMDYLIGDLSSLPSQNTVTVTKQLIDNESGQQFSNAMLETKMEELKIAVLPDNVAKSWNDADDVQSCSGESSAFETKNDDTSVHDCSTTNSKSERDTVTSLGEVSDNPLYQDTDEEQSGEVAVDDGVHTINPSQHSTLQPALTNPLQDEEILETGTRSRLITDTPGLVTLREDSHYPKTHHHKVTSWIDISENDSCYAKDQNFYTSDSSHDSEPESAEVTDSQVADDFYQLCGALVKNTADLHQQAPASRDQFSRDLISFGQVSRPCEVQEGEIATDAMSEGQSMDIWVSVPFPSRHSLQCVSLSAMLLWAVDSRGRVFYTTTSSRGKNWQHVKKAMQQISSSPTGHVVWSVYHQNSYVRLGIGMNPAGSMWKNITKNTSLAHKIKQLAVEDNGVWAITVDNRVLFRKGVDERNPEGRVWQELDYEMNFSFISCCKNVVWALTNVDKVLVRDGITPSSPSGKRWIEIKSPSMIAVSITSDGVVWGVNSEGSVGFRTGTNPGKPGGRGPWWEVMISSNFRSLSPLTSLWQVMSAEGTHSLSSAVSSLVSLPHQNQVTMVSASSASGVVVLEGGHRLHGCWKMATGYHYTPACREGIFQFNLWSRVAAGGTCLWFVRNDGDLYCLSPGSKLKRVEVPSNVELITASPNCMWVISKDMVWSRQGMTAELPEGISFDYIELSTLLHDKKLRSVACGNKVAWGIDSSGVPHFRFGVHAREPGTGMSPAWVPVEDHLGPLLQVAVSPDDWLVWACDEEYSVYARNGVTVDFPVGRKWVKILSQKIKELAATSDRMYGLTPSGELMCRHGISESNVQGSFWRKLPGKYEHISTGPYGELWTLDNKGQVWKQEWKVIQVSDMHLDFDAGADPESWEFI